jgi:hypothetical protein
MGPKIDIVVYQEKIIKKGTAANLRNALDKQYYAQLHDVRTAYCNVQPLMILEQLDDR